MAQACHPMQKHCTAWRAESLECTFLTSASCRLQHTCCARRQTQPKSAIQLQREFDECCGARATQECCRIGCTAQCFLQCNWLLLFPCGACAGGHRAALLCCFSRAAQPWPWEVRVQHPSQPPALGNPLSSTSPRRYRAVLPEWEGCY